MSPYPRDEFDDIDESTARRGAYRARPKANTTSARGLVLMVLSGVLALLVGGFMYVISPRTDSPEAAAEASASSNASPSEEAPAALNIEGTTVEIYNSSAPAGSAAVAARLIESKGYTVRTTGNWAGTYTTESTVNFATGTSSEANDIADTLSLPFIAQDYQAESGLVYVVLGADFDAASFEDVAETADPTEPAEEQGGGEASQAPESTPAASSQADAQGLYVLDPATGTFVEATESTASGLTRYSYDPATDTYQEYNPQQGYTPNNAPVVTYSYQPDTGTFVLDPAGTYIFDAATGTYVLR